MSRVRKACAGSYRRRRPSNIGSLGPCSLRSSTSAAVASYKASMRNNNRTSGQSTDLALYESTDTAFAIAHDFDAVDFFVSLKMLGETFAKLFEVDIRSRRKTARL